MTWHGILSDQQPVKVGGVEWSYTIAKQNKMKVVVWSHTIEWSGAFFFLRWRASKQTLNQSRA